MPDAVIKIISFINVLTDYNRFIATTDGKKSAGSEPSMTSMFENVTQAASQGMDTSLQIDPTQMENWRQVLKTNKKGCTYGLKWLPRSNYYQARPLERHISYQTPWSK
ncbi:hypothetical protein CRG98_011672 [Punica granatum]|uniref:Uncharacterized protein n=1 Tax=Punica granatum TaxID=22663 RepID=A0A2I0KJV4_PUNGR|nr:hypothetical protein CRG98_011672 [Punica granatum]